MRLEVAHINRAGPEKAVVGQVLENSSRPAGNSRHGEDRREHVDVDPHRVVNETREEIDVRENSLPAEVGHDNAQGEQYLTDVIGWLVARNMLVKAVQAPAEEGLGVNTVEQLAAVSTALLGRDQSGSPDGTSSLR